MDDRQPAAAPSSLPLRSGGKTSSNRDIAVVQADYLALANDLEQAQALASTLEIQLSGKTNELAQLKVIWERTHADLLKFEHDLDIMRKERHSLANEVQMAYAYQHKFERLKIAHEDLTSKAARIEAELALERSAHAQTREALARERDMGPQTSPGLSDPALRENLEGLRDQIDRILAAQPGKTAAANRRPAAASRVEQDHIDIEFCT